MESLNRPAIYKAKRTVQISMKLRFSLFSSGFQSSFPCDSKDRMDLRVCI